MSSIKKNFLYNSLYQIMVMFIPLITTPYISRTLGASGVGTYSYAYSVANYYVLFIMLGLNNYGNRTIAKIRDDKNELRKTFWSIYSMQLMLGIIINIIYFIYCFNISADMKVSLAVGLYVISGCFDINWLFFGLEKFKLTVVRNTAIKILTTASIFIFVKDQNDVLIYCLIMTLGMLISQFALWPFILKNIKFYKPDIKEITVHIKPNLFLFLTVIAVSLFKVMDKVMLGMMSGSSQVGYYESAEKIIQVPTALITSLGTVMLPRMTNMVNKNENQNKRMIYLSIQFAMFISTSLCFGIMGVSKEFVPLFYGNGFEVCIYLYIILLPSCVFLAFANVIRTQYLLPHQMDKPYVISAFLGAGVNIIINMLLIPYYGCIGAAIGTFFAEMSVFIFQCFSVKKYLPIKKYLLKSMYFIFSGIAMFLCLYNLNFTGMTYLTVLIIKIIIGILVYFLLLGIQMMFQKFILKKSIF
ncbi:MAG: flippase [Thomasclavelia sp.]